jgi:hypothetical protein
MEGEGSSGRRRQHRDNWLRGGGEANPGATVVQPEGVEPRTTRANPGLIGPVITGAGAAVHSVGVGSATTGKAVVEARPGRTKA